MNEKYTFTNEIHTHVYEWCPHCETEVKLDSLFEKQTCPNCGETILPCALCDCDTVKCNECPLEIAKEATTFQAMPL